jgi:hypothetical protein
MEDGTPIKVHEGKYPNSSQPPGSGCVVEVFKTNVEHETEAKDLVEMLRQHFPGSHVNFDLQDRDRILRVQGKELCVDTILSIMKTAGFICIPLE